MSGWEDESLNSRFTKDSFEAILMLLNIDDIDSQISALETLSETLSYANEDILQEFPVNEIAQAMVANLNSTHDYVQEQAAQCIFTFLEAHTASTRSLCAANLLPTLKSIFERPNQSLSSGINCIRAMEVISEFRPGELGEVIGLAPYFKFYSQLRNIDKRSAIHAVSNITQAYRDQSFPPYLAQIAPCIRDQDARIRRNSVFSFYNIVNNNKCEKVDPIILPSVLSSIPLITDPQLQFKVLQPLAILSTISNFIAPMINANFDFLQFTDPIVLTIVLNLLPPSGLPDTRQRDTLPVSVEYARRIAPQIIALCADDTHINAVIALAVIAKAVPDITLPLQLLQHIAGLSMDPQFVIPALLLALNVADAGKSGLVAMLKNAKPADNAPWFNEHVTQLSHTALRVIPQFATFRELAAYLVAQSVSGIELLGCDNFAKNCMDLIANTTDFTGIDLDAFANLIFEVLSFFPLPKPRDSFTNRSAVSLANTNFPVRINLQPQEVDIPEESRENSYTEMSTTASFVALENWFNTEVLGGGSDDVLNVALVKSPLGKIVQLDNPDQFTYTSSGVWHRILKTSGYKSVKVFLGDKELSIYDSVIATVSRRLEAPNMLFDEHVTFRLEPHEPFGDTVTALSPVVVPLKIDPRLKQFLDVLKALTKSGCSLRCDLLERRLLPFFDGAINTISLFSPAVQIVAHYPFLFSKVLKIKTLKTTCLMPYGALEAFGHGKLGCKRDRARCVVSRDHIFEDGKLIIDTLMPTPLFIEVSFTGEEGIGQGPTQEFYTLLGEEFTRVSRALWLNEKHGEFCFSEQGLYPSPAADPALFESLGVLCGKAVNDEQILPLQFNTTFFKLVKGEPVKIEEVSTALAKTLSSPDGLVDMPFVYPGLDVELCKGGADRLVTADNLDEYIKLITEFTVGERAHALGAAFLRGFHKVVAPGLLDILTAGEICDMIAGEAGTGMTAQDIEQNIEISHGYNKKSPQIAMLTEVLAGLNGQERAAFFKFVTGCERLPIGGLAALEPKLTVARRADEGVPADAALPSVMTCMNYFKLPAYSTKEIMAAKLKFAIMEGQSQFSLS